MAAVIPIMKLLLVVVTFMGRFIAQSMPRTFRAPLPMPRRPDMNPAATGSSIYWFAGYIQPFLAAATAIGVLAGAYLGSKILVRITNVRIRWIFFWVLAFLGVDMIFSGIAIKQGLPSTGTVSYIGFGVSIVISIVLLLLLYAKVRRDRIHA